MAQENFFTRQNLIFFLAVTILGLIFMLRPHWEFGGDNNGYYMYLRSLYFDHDLNFANELAYYDGLYGTKLSETAITPVGKLGDPFSVGVSIFWLLFFLVARIVDWIAGANLQVMPGYSPVYSFFLSLGSIFYAIAGSAFLFSGLRKIFRAGAAWFAAIAVVFVSPLLHYLVYEPLMSHAISFGINGALFWFSMKIYKAEKIGQRDLAILGVLAGLAVLVRWQEALALILPAGILAQKYLQKKLKIRQALLSATIAVILFIPQIAVWRYLFGSFLVVPQGQNFIKFEHLKIFEVLFSGTHGLFSWHPLLFLGLIGLVFSYKKDRLLFYLLLSVFIGQILINASLVDWWGGSAFGARKMIGTLFVFAYGFAFLLDRFYVKRCIYWGLLLVLLLGSLWNYLLMVSVPKGYLSISRFVPVQKVYSAPFRMIIGEK